MNKELKLLIISFIGIIIRVIFFYWQYNYTCSTVEYQDSQGTHSKVECIKKAPKTCWDKYATEELAIEHCEGK